MIRKRWQEHSSMRIVLGVCIVLAMYQMYSYAVKSYQDYQINQQISDSEAEIKKLESENRLMQEYLKYLSSEAYKEKEAKRIKNVKNPDEDVFVIKQEGLEKATSQDDQAMLQWQSLSTVGRWWRFFTR